MYSIPLQSIIHWKSDLSLFSSFSSWFVPYRIYYHRRKLYFSTCLSKLLELNLNTMYRSKRSALNKNKAHICIRFAISRGFSVAIVKVFAYFRKRFAECVNWIYAAMVSYKQTILPICNTTTHNGLTSQYDTLHDAYSRKCTSHDLLAVKIIVLLWWQNTCFS